MTAFDFAHQHPWWTLLYVVVLASAIANTLPISIIVRPRHGEAKSDADG